MKLGIINKNYDPKNDVSFCLLFTFGGPVVALLAAMALGKIGNGLENSVPIGLLLAHAVVAISFGIAALWDRPDVPISWGSAIAVVLGLILAGCTLLGAFALPSALSRAREYKTPRCENVLKHWGWVHHRYAGLHDKEHDREHLPPLSPHPGHLMMAISDMYPEYLTDLAIMQCPKIRNIHLDVPHDSELFEIVSDQSYFYLGYMIDGPETMRSFKRAYEKVIIEGENFESDLLVPDGQGTWGGDKILRLRKTHDALAPGIAPESEDQAMVRAQEMSRIPVMIERVGHHPLSSTQAVQLGNVLYLDGHVEAHKYPGDWPMTEEFMTTLQELDRMGPYIPDGTFQGPPGARTAQTMFAAMALGGLLFGLWRFGRFPGITVPLFYLLLGTGVLAAATLGPNRMTSLSRTALPVAAPGGEITYRSVESSGE